MIEPGIRISDYPKLLLRSLGALEEANADKVAIRSIVDKHNRKLKEVK